jgi:RHS repeat-associated protein
MFDTETGLQNNLHRWYDPGTGRWLNEDPIGFAAGDANLYRYVGNGVTGARDPKGLRDEQIDLSDSTENSSIDIIRRVWHALGNDVGTPFARELAAWYIIGNGEPFHAGQEYDYNSDPPTERGFGKRGIKSIPVHNYNKNWAIFLREIEQVQFVIGRALAAKAKEIARQNYSESNVRFGISDVNVRLSSLQSMRMTLGGGTIEIEGLYDICPHGSVISGAKRVTFHHITAKWIDVGDLHSGKNTQLDDYTTIDDQEMLDLGMGKPFPIDIRTTIDYSIFDVRNGHTRFVGGYPHLSKERIEFWKEWIDF